MKLSCQQLGTARGCGWQNIGACVNFGSYYLVGIPSAILLAFIFKLGGKVRNISNNYNHHLFHKMISVLYSLTMIQMFK